MLEKSLCKLFIIPLAVLPWLGMGNHVNALPGQSTEEVTSWIQANETLGPNEDGKLFVQRNDTAALRLNFRASVLPPGKVHFTKDRAKIRTEIISMYDAANGMTVQRLQESLRVIYGLDIEQDFNQAQVVYKYPNESAINAARFAKTPLREALQGELRLGDCFVYWVEIPQPKQSKAYFGQMTVFLKADLNKLESELRNR